MRSLQKKNIIMYIIIILFAVLLFSCSVNKEFNYSSKPSFEVMYSEDTNTSEVSIAVYIDNSNSDADMKSLTFKCFFLDDKNNILDTQEKIFDVSIKKGSSGTYVFIFESVKGHPQNINLINTASSFNSTVKENISRWLLHYWWVVLIIVAYVAFAILIGYLCGSFIVASFDLTELEFWISLSCGLFWPLGGIILLIVYLKEEVFIGNASYVETKEDFENWTVEELKEYCRDNEIIGYSKLKKDELISLIESARNGSEVDEKSFSKQVSSKGNRNHDSSIPTIKFSDIAGLEEAKQAIQERIVLPLQHKDIYEKYGKKVGGGILLYGLPGTGKTMFAQAVATELNASFFSIKCSDIMSKWYGESEQKIKKVFSDARKSEVSVIFFDEFEAIARSRNGNEDSNITTVQEILAQMQGVEQHKNLTLVLAATNCPWNIDSALLRPGRFHEKIFIPLPDLPARSFLLNKLLGKLKKEEKIVFEEIAKQLEGFNGADVTEFCEQIKMSLINKELSGESNVMITLQDIDKALQKVHSSVDRQDIEAMEKFRSL